MNKVIVFIANNRFLHNLISFIINLVPQFIHHNISKYFSIKKIIYSINIDQVQGDYCEFGCFTGASLNHALNSYKKYMSHKKMTFYGFDSFLGLPEPTQEDKPESDPDKIFKGRFTWSKQETIDSMLLNGLPEEFLENKIHLIEGWFENTFQEYKGNGVALLHIDVDNYMPYKESLEHFYPLVNKGGAITFDEYNDPVWAGAPKAVDEFFSYKPEQVIKSKFYRYYVIKE